MTVEHLHISGRAIGPGERPYVIAEAGVHHYNSLDLARELVSRAAAAGADAVKFQTYTASRLAARWAPTYWESTAGATQYDIFAERSLLVRDDYAELFTHAARVGITCLSTPFDPDAAEMLAGLGMPAFKIASADITDLPLLRACAAHGRPMLLSTGASTMQEVHRAVDAVRAEGASVGLLHCTLAYPTPLSQANLRRLEMLAIEFPDVVLGYSDHTQPQDSEYACPTSVALGASIVEKHFTLDKSLPGDDHYHAVDPEGLARLVKNCTDVWMMTREPVEIEPAEEAARSYARRSVVAARNLRAHTILQITDVDFKRPGTGIDPSEVASVLGRRLTRDFAEDELIDLDGLE